MTVPRRKMTSTLFGQAYMYTDFIHCLHQFKKKLYNFFTNLKQKTPFVYLNFKNINTLFQQILLKAMWCNLKQITSTSQILQVCNKRLRCNKFNSVYEISHLIFVKHGENKEKKTRHFMSLK